MLWNSPGLVGLMCFQYVLFFEVFQSPGELARYMGLLWIRLLSCLASFLFSSPRLLLHQITRLRFEGQMFHAKDLC